MQKKLMFLIVLAFLVASCLPGQSPEEVQAQINTAVAQTMSAQQQIEESVALTVQAQSPLATPTLVEADTTETPTSTPLAFPTLTPLAFTFTPLPPPSSGGGGGTVSKRDYSCDIAGRRPFDNTEFNPGDDFDIKWTIINTGTKTWDPGFDVKYFSGPNMSGFTLVEIPVEMKPNAQYQIVMDGTAPAEKGFQVMTWTVSGNGTAQLCYPYVAIIVK